MCEGFQSCKKISFNQVSFLKSPGWAFQVSKAQRHLVLCLEISILKKSIEMCCLRYRKTWMRKKDKKKYHLALLHWCIKSIYNGFAIAIDCTLKVVPFGFCSVLVMHLFRISFWLLRRSEFFFGLQRLVAFLGFRQIWG